MRCIGVNDYHQSSAVYNSATLPQYYADSRWPVIRPPLSSHPTGNSHMFTGQHFVQHRLHGEVQAYTASFINRNFGERICSSFNNCSAWRRCLADRNGIRPV